MWRAVAADRRGAGFGPQAGGCRWVVVKAAVGETVAGEPGCSCLTCWSCCQVVTPIALVVATTSTMVEISWVVASYIAASSSVVEASSVAPWGPWLSQRWELPPTPRPQEPPRLSG